MSDRKPHDQDDDLDFSLPGEHHGAQADEHAPADDYDFSMPAPREAEQAHDAPAPAAPEQDGWHSGMHRLLAFGDGLMGNYGGEIAKLATRGAKWLSPEGLAGGDEGDPEHAQQLVDQASQEHPYAHGGGQAALGVGTALAAGPGIAAQALAGGATSAASEYGQSHDGVAAGIAGGVGAGVSGVAAGVGALGARLLAKGPPPKINEGMLAASQRMPAALEGRAAGDATHEVSMADMVLAQQQAPQAAAPAPRGAPDPVEWLRAHGMDPHAQDLGRSQAVQPGAPTQLVRDTAAQFPGQSAPTAAANPIARASMAGPSDLTQAQHTLSPAPVMRPGGAPVPQPPPPAPIGPPTAPPIGPPTAAPPAAAPAPMPPQAPPPPPLPAPAPAPMPAPAPAPPPPAAPAAPPWHEQALALAADPRLHALLGNVRGGRTVGAALKGMDYAVDKVGDKFAAGARPNEIARWGTIGGTEATAELGGAMWHDKAGGKDSAAAATSNVVNWALKRVLSSPNSGLSQQDSQALNQAMMSGDQQATASQLYNAVSKSPAFAAKYEREQKRAAGEH